MIDLPELFILDVGHGNCAILKDSDVITVIDCPPSPVLVEVLERLGIDTIDNILISHSDVDHVGGLSNLLQNIFIRNIYINPDADKRGAKGVLWKGIRIALDRAEQEGTHIHPSLTTVLSKKIYAGVVEIEILSPSPSLALGGAGGEDLEGRKLNANSMSVVIGLVHNSCRVALLPGDMDEIGLDNLLKKHKDLESRILVFPHHGGTPGSENTQQFAYQLCNLVKPSLVLFSFNRNKFENPRKETVEGTMLAVPDTHIMCTQLSKNCALKIPLSDFRHLTNLPAGGVKSNICCGGTVLVKINGEQTTYLPSIINHRQFVTDKTMIPTPLCLHSTTS